MSPKNSPKNNKTMNSSDEASANLPRLPMISLHRHLAHRDWKIIQSAIAADSSVAMRISDDAKEDLWFRVAREARAAHDPDRRQKMNADTIGDIKMSQQSDSQQVVKTVEAEALPLRHWGGGSIQASQDGGVDDSVPKMSIEIQQKRTLLHSLCRLRFPSDNGLVEQLKSGDSGGIQDLMGAVQTAKMLISASHCSEDCDENCSCCNCRHQNSKKKLRCSCHWCDCPPAPLSPVERSFAGHQCSRQQYWQSAEPRQRSEHIMTQNDTTNSNIAIAKVTDAGPKAKKRFKLIVNVSSKLLHTSVLTMTDQMGETPLHSLTGAGTSHPDLLRAILDGCRPQTVPFIVTSEAIKSDDGAKFKKGGYDRRPTVYSVLSAQNCRGCTPFHFVCDVSHFESLQVLLRESAPYLSHNQINFHEQKLQMKFPIHPTLIPDNEGDLPLHFVACNGGSVRLFSNMLTAGDVHSTLIRNSQGRLPVDDLIIWYMDSIVRVEDIQGEPLDGRYDSDEMDDDDSDSSESTEDSSDNDADLEQHRVQIDMDDQSIHLAANGEAKASKTKRFNPNDPKSMIERLLPWLFYKGNEEDNPAVWFFSWRVELWEKMYVLIQAAATAACSRRSKQPGGNSSTPNNTFPIIHAPWDPIHAAIIATKHGNFPALALIMTLYQEENLTTALAREDSCGYIPLHIACGGISQVFPSYDVLSDGSETTDEHKLGRDYLVLNNQYYIENHPHYSFMPFPDIVPYKEVVRWNSQQLPCSMIQYLIQQFPQSARIPTSNGRTPLQLALEHKGITGWSLRSVEQGCDGDSQICRWKDIKALLRVCPEALATRDITTHMYPFQTAAAYREYPLDRQSDSSFMKMTPADEDSKPESTDQKTPPQDNDNKSTSLAGTFFDKSSRLISLENTYRLILEDPSLCCTFQYQF